MEKENVIQKIVDETIQQFEEKENEILLQRNPQREVLHQIVRDEININNRDEKVVRLSIEECGNGILFDSNYVGSNKNMRDKATDFFRIVDKNIDMITKNTEELGISKIIQAAYLRGADDASSCYREHMSNIIPELLNCGTDVIIDETVDAIAKYVPLIEIEEDK